jgi:hypothetical protein
MCTKFCFEYGVHHFQLEKVYVVVLKPILHPGWVHNFQGCVMWKKVGPSLLGMENRRHVSRRDPYKIDLTGVRTGFERGGKFRQVLRINQIVSYKNRGVAVVGVLMAPLWIPLRAIVSVANSVLNILSGGWLSVKRGYVDNSFSGKVKAVSCSFLSLATTPLNIVVEGVAALSHVVFPEENRIDLLAAHMWSGFVGAHKDKSSLE